MSIDFLVVDNSPAVRRMIHRTLRMGALQVNRILEAEDGQEASDILDKEWVDGIIAEWDAWIDQDTRLVQWLTSDEVMHEIPTLALMSDGRPSTVEAAGNQNVTNILIKPFQPEELYNSIKLVGVYDRE